MPSAPKGAKHGGIIQDFGLEVKEEVRKTKDERLSDRGPLWGAYF
jgi:hypothetical protein